jgi:DNA segregation ATPase FtsK/SpoIIIE, S-DNA-T family
MAKRGRKRKGLFRSLKLKPNTIRTIFFIFFAALTAISVLSFLQKGSKLIELNSFLTLYFGFFSLLVPFLLLLLTFTFIKSKIPLKEPTIFIGFVFIFISFLSLFQSGIVGEFLWNQLLTLFGHAGTLIIYIFCLIVGIVVLFDTNIIDIFRIINKTFKAIKKYTIGNNGVNIKKFNCKKIYRNESKAVTQNKIDSSSKEDMSHVGIPPILKEIKEEAPLNINLKNNELGQTQIWQYPSLSLFDNNPGAPADRGDVGKNAHTIEETLDSFGITAKVVEINDSPSVTQYALEVALGTKLAKIVSLSNDLAMALSAPGGQIRIEAPIPGRSFVGIEVPNRSLQVVPIRKILENDTMKLAKSKISVPLGLDVAGKPKIGDITKMPHVLIAGQTGSGKSVCINSWICSLLFRSSPDEVKLILVDPKRVELTPYNEVPHLLQPVIVEPEKVLSALKWAVTEMESRYKQLTEAGVRNIDSYNENLVFRACLISS